MSVQIQQLLKEMDAESVVTRKMLERVPNDKYDWKPHPKSMSMRELATHIADLPNWVAMALTTEELDFSKNPYNPEKIDDTAHLLDFYSKSFQYGRQHLENADEKKFDEQWTLRNGEQIYSVSSKYEVIRLTFCQNVHHRAQLGVFLRLLDIPIPGSYGPSADETNF